MDVGEYGQGFNTECDFGRKTAQLKARPGLKRADEVVHIQRCAGCRAQQGGTGQIPQQRVGVGYVDSHVIPGRLEGESASPVHAPKSV